jgi:Trypsin-co-occurring domain 2
VSESEGFDGALGLADFLSDLRAELAEASRRAENDSLRLGVEEVTVSLDVAITLANKGEASAKATAKFWVLASVEGGVRGEHSSQRAATQHLTLTLKPRTEKVIIDPSGEPRVVRRDVDVAGALEADEQNPRLPAFERNEQ